MSSPQTIRTTPLEHPAQDYGALRAEGIRTLERLAGAAWTDFNAHDPGITLLEQLCYAITELGYRAAHEVPDLLCGRGEPYSSLHSAATVLTGEPVTLLDLRKLVLDVEGVRDAWVEIAAASGPKLAYHEAEMELRVRDDGAAAELSRSATPVAVTGLFQVFLALSDVADAAAVRREVIRRLHAHRPLCTDFTEVRVLDPEDIQVQARIEIAPGLDPAAALLSIHDKIADHITPSVHFRTLGELIAAGVAMEEIFSGPRLSHGFIDSGSLARMERRAALHTSDILHDLMDIPGVRAVRDIALTSSLLGQDKPQLWALSLRADRAPRFDHRNSSILLLRGGAALDVDAAAVSQLFQERRKAAAARRLPAAAELDRLPPPGRDREVRRYTSIQRQLPACYGVGEGGLTSAAPAPRRGQRKQLQAYLLFFDQLLCNAFAQLGHAPELLSFDGEGARTYESQPVDDAKLGLDAVRRTDRATHAAWLQKMAGAPARSRSSPEREQRFLDHLLARFAETHPVYSPVTSPGETAQAATARDKRAFLRLYPRISGARGTGCDLTRARGEDNQSGLQQRIQRALGLAAAETFLLIEHILLRPMAEDLSLLAEGELRPFPLLASSPLRDPYSLRLSAVFPGAVGRFAGEAFRAIVEQALRAETPAHLIVHVRWLAPDAYARVSALCDEWASKHRSYWTDTLGG